MSYIQVRIDEERKQAAKKILDKLGIDMSTAIKIYLSQIVINAGIPFRIVTENGLTIKKEQTILRASKEARAGKNIVRKKGKKEVKNYLNSLK